MRIRSGSSALALTMASSPFSAITTWKPFLASVSSMYWRSVGESSTTRIFLTGMSFSAALDAVQRVCADGLQQAVFGKGFGQVLVRPDHPAARAVEQAVLGGQHDH